MACDTNDRSRTHARRHTAPADSGTRRDAALGDCGDGGRRHVFRDLRIAGDGNRRLHPARCELGIAGRGVQARLAPLHVGRRSRLCRPGADPEPVLHQVLPHGAAHRVRRPRGVGGKLAIRAGAAAAQAGSASRAGNGRRLGDVPQHHRRAGLPGRHADAQHLLRADVLHLPGRPGRPCAVPSVPGGAGDRVARLPQPHDLDGRVLFRLPDRADPAIGLDRLRHVVAGIIAACQRQRRHVRRGADAAADALVADVRGRPGPAGAATERRPASARRKAVVAPVHGRVGGAGGRRGTA